MASFGSSLIRGLFLMFLARFAWQRRHRFVKVVVCRAQVGDHNSLSIAAKSVLDITGELRITIRDV